MSIVQAHDSAALRRKMLALMGGASAVSLMCAMPAYAQDDTGSDPVVEEDDDVVVARGIRRSLQSAQDIKRDSDTFVDAVTAEDIGALPDRSITEALSRVPGVQISRFAAADDPDHFSIEGQGVLVRGLTFVRSELNGRDTFSANNGRALSFADVPSELVGSVQVYKNQTADLIEGGIAGSVNLVTRKPFDSAGQVIAGSLEYNYADFREEWAPTFSGLYSNNWEGDFGRFGLLVNAVNSELKTRSDGTQISSFQPFTSGFTGGTEAYIPEGAVFRTQDYDRERTGYGASAQWENPDRTVQATAEFLRSEATTSWNEHVSEIATDNFSEVYPLPGTTFAFDDMNRFTSGTISSVVGWRSDQNGSDPRTPIYGYQSNNVFRGVEQEYVTADYSFNVKITPNDRWSFNLDYQFIDSTVENIDFTLWGSTYQDVFIDTQAGDIPEVRFLPPNETGNPDFGYAAVDCSGGVSGSCPSYFDAPHDSYADPYNSFWRAAMDHFEDSEGTENAFRGDAQYNFEDAGWLQSARVGVRWAERDQTTRFSTYNWGALSEIWGNDGPVWFDEVGVPEGLVDVYTFDNFQRGDVTQPPSLPYFSLNPAQNYGAAADFADSVVAQWLANGGNTGGAQGGGGGWRRLAERPGVVPGTPYLPGEIADVTEENFAAYVRFDYSFDNVFDSNMTLDGNFGLRYVETTLTSTGSYQFPDGDAVFPVTTGLGDVADPDNPDFPGGDNRCVTPIQDDMGPGTGTPQPDFEAPGFCALDDATEAQLRQFANNGSQEVASENEYDILLPSFNAKLGLNDDMLLRFAYSKSISRPDVGSLRNNFTLSVLGQDDPRTDGPDPTPGGSGFFGFGAAGGNPFLEPVKADNYDVSFEWYFADVGSLTVSAFYKEIEDIIVGGQGDIPFANNGVTVSNVFTRQPTNSDETGKVKGFEVAYQQFYDGLPEPFDGLGSQITYTFIDSEGVASSGVNSTGATPAGNINPDTGEAQSQPLVDGSQFPLEGLSEHNWNVAAIYEKGPISTRLVYNWRSDYLVTLRDVITPFYPIFQDSTGQLDGSFFYSVNENFKIGVQGANLLNEITVTDQYVPSGDLRAPRSFFQNDRRFTVSARFNF
ncbi:TonB-dependent receptor [Parvularcula marina]|uniref:TonB-dependent receptor n=2 Tax=Parvularcula marina TaxID=2292771 RepID=A0A371RFT7_9PROT|nr:TonB-dependent receptor [Parvularcula marina]